MKRWISPSLWALALVLAPLSTAQEGGLQVEDDPSGGLSLDSEDGGTDPDVSLDPNRSAADPLGPRTSSDFTLPGRAEDPEEPRETWVLPESVQNLSREQKKEITDLLTEASTLLRGIRLQEAMAALNKIEAYTKELYITHNLRGAVYTKLRNFDRARSSFQRVLELRPGLLEARFNLAELDFVQHRFPLALEQFQEIKKENPRMDPPTAKMIDFKIFVAYLMQSQEPGDAFFKKAQAVMDTFDFLDDEPAYYCANAALAYVREDKPDAEQWLNSARSIYGNDPMSVYVDSMIEMGWIQPDL